MGSLDANACDLVMPDLERIGGVSGWLGASALAGIGDLPAHAEALRERREGRLERATVALDPGQVERGAHEEGPVLGVCRVLV